MLGMAACTAGEDISIANRTDADVLVRLGSEDVGEVTSDGGVVLLDTTECYDGPIVVTYADQSTFELQEAICPGQTLLVDSGSAEIFDEPAVN
ncbi:hypothetical protein [uncultured Cellulomonas sp.]|uniref:hypothetical protein n=1 Tax=uncultured Cellulomonas sp. TaxID=189682 RepID=UPI00261D2D0F|nr:hypothetical protein [uncultured Cellulomonas sp.]